MYKITIEKKEQKVVEDSEYEKIADSGNEKDNGAIYGYVPRKVTKNISTVVYEQSVSELDIGRVAIFINEK